MNELNGQVAFITGGSSGIGKASALRLARLGMKVAICARRKEKLDRALKELQAITPHAAAFTVDITHLSQVESCVKQIETQLGPIDVLINNAGIYRFGSIFDTTPDHWDMQFDINLKAPFLVTKAVAPSMVERKTGRIIFISSTIALISPELNTCYTACKWGLEGFVGSMAQEMLDHNINVHVVRPGFTDTDVFEEIGKPDLEIDWIEPDEIAGAIEFLCRLPWHAQVPDLTYMTTFQRRSH